MRLNAAKQWLENGNARNLGGAAASVQNLSVISVDEGKQHDPRIFTDFFQHLFDLVFAAHQRPKMLRRFSTFEL